MNCIVPLQFYFPDVLDALEELLHHCIQKRDGKTANEVQSLIDILFRRGSSFCHLLYGMIYCFK